MPDFSRQLEEYYEQPPEEVIAAKQAEMDEMAEEYQAGAAERSANLFALTSELIYPPNPTPATDYEPLDEEIPL